MSELTKKRVHWKEYNGEELIHDEDVDVLTSADAVTFSDGETMQYKYTQGQFVSPSETGYKSNLSTTNKSTLVDAINEVKTDATSNESSIGSLTNRVTTAESDIDSLEGRMTTAESDIDSLENRVTPINLGGTGATTVSGAISNLGVATTETYTATLTSSGWSSAAPYTQTVTVTGILTTDNPVIDVVLSTTTSTALNQLEAWGNVSKIVTETDSITATCLEDKPEVDIHIQIKVVR